MHLWQQCILYPVSHTVCCILTHLIALLNLATFLNLCPLISFALRHNNMEKCSSYWIYSSNNDNNNHNNKMGGFFPVITYKKGYCNYYSLLYNDSHVGHRIALD